MSCYIATAQTDGSLDTAFGTNGKVITSISAASVDFAYDAIQLNDSKILVAGYTTVNVLDMLLLKYLPNGQLDTTFGTNGISIIEDGTQLSQVRKVGLQSNGKIILAGRSGPQTAYATIARADANGALDTTFGTNGFTRKVSGTESDIQALMVLPDDKIIVVGYVLNNTSNIQVIKLNANGSFDTTFGTNGVKVIAIGSFGQRAFCATTNGNKILIGGVINNPNESSLLVQLNADGSLDTTFGTDGYSVAQFGSNPQNRYDRFSAIKVFENSIYAVGSRAIDAFNYKANLAKFTINGTLDTTFSDDGKLLVTTTSQKDFINDIQVLQEGYILLAGVTSNSSSNFLMIKLNTDGTFKTNFGTNGIVTTSMNSASNTIQKVIVNETNLIAVGASNTAVASNIAIAKYNNSNLLAIKNYPDFSDKFKMYPNPVESMLHISNYTQEQIDSIQILDATGKVIIRKNDNTESINIQSLPGGIYFLKIFTLNSTYTSKIIKR